MKKDLKGTVSISNECKSIQAPHKKGNFEEESEMGKKEEMST